MEMMYFPPEKTFKDYLIIPMLIYNHRKGGINMYLRMLKKDLKRKKTMNIILLLFVILATMFASSSVNNISTVINGLDNYFEKADLSDHFVINTSNNGDEINDLIAKKSSVKDFRREDQLFFDDKCLTRNGKKLAEQSGILLALSIDNAKINYFDKNNEVITEVKEGTAYLTGLILSKIDLEIGEKISLKIGDTEQTFSYAGIAKDAFLGSDMMGNSRIIINNKDYEKFTADEKAVENNSAQIFYINGYDQKELASDLSDLPNVPFNKDINLIRTSYIMNSVVAGLLLIVSICLILVSFVTLRFTISFTINEDFREIGVMKALGLRNNSVRGLYLVKYLGIAIIGAVIGFAISIPFGNALIQSVSENMVLENDNALIINIICSLAVIAVILLFCWSCTRKIKKLSPIDAVRSGQTGERFKKKGFLHLGKSKLGTTGFLAVNDVFSSPKQFGIMTVIFSVCLLLIMGLANTANTLASEKLLPKMCATKSDAYITDTKMISSLIGGETTYNEIRSEIEQKLDENGMPGKVHSEAIVFPLIESNDKKATSAFMYCADTKASEYEYTEGYGPKYANEVALTKILADKLDVGVGDKVNITLDGKTDEYIVSALFNSLVQLGETGRFHESVEIPDKLLSNVLGFQIDFDDHPDTEETEKRIEKMKDIFDSKYIDDADGFVADCIGDSVKDTIGGVKLMVLIITAIIIIMISVLIERSIISKEKPEIALMKAMGFKTGSVIAQHTLRFVVVAITASVIAAALCLPVTKLCIDPVFSILGALNGVDYNIRPVEIYAVYPLVVITATITGAFLTALYMKKIKASDTSDIE